MGRTYSVEDSVIYSARDELPLLVILNPVEDRVSVCERNELRRG